MYLLRLPLFVTKSREFFRPVLSPAAPRDLAYPQVIRMLKAAKMKLKGKTGLFFSVRFMRPPKSSKKDDTEKGEDRGPTRQGRSYDISFDEGPLGIVFGVTEVGVYTSMVTIVLHAL